MTDCGYEFVLHRKSAEFQGCTLYNCHKIGFGFTQVFTGNQKFNPAIFSLV